MSKTTIDTPSVLAGLKVNAAAIAWYATILKHWHKQAGGKPTDAMLYVPVLMGKRPGVEALHIAMSLRAEGCTVQQFCLAGSCGPANNYRRALVKAGWLTCTVEGKPYAFKLGLTAKGADKLVKAQAAAAAAATLTTVDPKPSKKGKVSRKANKAKHKPTDAVADVTEPVNAPAETPTSEPATVTEGQAATA